MTSWRNAQGYDGRYQVSNEGAVRNAAHRPLKMFANRHGYLQVWLSLNGKAKCHRVHRLVAEAFIPNPDNKPLVNHINGDTADNRVENLEWCSASENQMHSAYILQKESGKPKRPVLCKDTGHIYRSESEAARAVGGSKQNISDCCLGKRQHHKGLRWAYAEEVCHGWKTETDV